MLKLKGDKNIFPKVEKVIEQIANYFGENMIAVIIQIVAMPIYIASFWAKKKTLLVLQIFASLLFAVGFALMGAYAGAITSIFTLIPTILIRFYDYEKHKKLWLHVLFLVSVLLGVGADLICYVNAFDLLMIGGGIVFSYAIVYCKENELSFKLIMIVAHICFVIYEFICQTYIFAIMDVATLLSIIFSMFMQIRQRRAEK